MQVIPALGRTAKLGQLYDANRGIFCGQEIFTVADITKACSVAVNTTDNGTFSSKSIIINSTIDKFDFLDVEASLKLTVLTVVALEGSGKYLKDTKSSKRSSMITLSAEVTTKEESFNISDNSLKKYFTPNCDETTPEATHYVSKIVWGGRAFLSVTDSNTENDDKAVIEGQLSATVKQISFQIEGGGEAKYNSESSAVSRHYEYSIRSDSIEEIAPSTVEEAMVLWRSIPAKLRKQNGGKGIPLSFHLSPISEFYKQMDAAKLSFQMEKKIEISILKSVEEFLSDLESCEQRITDIKTDSERLKKHVSTKMRNGLKDLEKYFSRNIPSFRSDIYEILQEVRLGNEEISALVDRRKDFIDQLTNPFDKLQSLEKVFAENCP